MELKKGALVPWRGKVMVVHCRFADGRYRLMDGPVYDPANDLVTLERIQEEIRSLPHVKVPAIVRHKGFGSYGIRRRYWSTAKGCILYDLEEWGAKPGHNIEWLYGIPGEELTVSF